MAYVSDWERLGEVLNRVMATGLSRDQAQSDICKAVAEGAIRLRVRPRSHMTRGTTSKKILAGNQVDIPVNLKPEALDWERSRPENPWPVSREVFGYPGHWHLKWIKLYAPDVAKVLCGVGKQGASTLHASSETPATSTIPPALSQTPVGLDGRSRPSRQKNAAGPARRRGRRPQKFEQARDAMMNDIQHGRCTVPQLDDMLEKDLVAKYDVSRDTARKARKAVLSELNSRQIPTNDK